MLELTKGNLLEAPVEALVNTVNSVGIMGKGIALQFRQAFPQNYQLYRVACERGDVVPGRMFVTTRLENPRFIINFPTKRHWKSKSKLEDIDAGLKALVDVIAQENIRSIALPPLGCGNGGLDWKVVRPRIEMALGELTGVRVLLYSPEGAPAPDAMVVATKRPAMNANRAALVAAMIGYGDIGYRLTLLEIQKLAYFLQAAGQPLSLVFAKQQYGPYAETLNHVLQRLEGHFLRGYGDRSREASVLVLAQGREEANRFLESEAATVSRLERVGELIEGFETPHGMELLATVHWVAGENPAARASPDQAVLAVHEWNERKARVFPTRHIQIAHEQLKRLGWI